MTASNPDVTVLTAVAANSRGVVVSSGVVG